MPGIPDAHYIREKVPIRDVARKLGLKVHPNNMIQCWHPENHHHGDRTPSVGIQETQNFVKCFGIGCDGKLLGNIDLVIDVQGLHHLPEKERVGKAIAWIAANFPEVPTIAKNKSGAGSVLFMYGTEEPMTLLVKSGIFGKLSHPAQRLAAVLFGLRTTNCSKESDIPSREWDVSISYFTMRKLTGIASDQTISKALQELEEIGWARRERPKPEYGTGPIKKSTVIRVIPYSEEVYQLGNALAAAHKQASEYQIAERRELRRKRHREYKRDWRNGQKNAVESSQL